MAKAFNNLKAKFSNLKSQLDTGSELIQGGWAMHRVPRVPSKNVLPDRSLKGKTMVVTGGTRGIGLAIAVRAARDGANVAILGKTNEPHPNLPGTIHTAVKEVEQAGGKGIAIVCDVRRDEQLEQAMEATVKAFGGIDILVNNASAINLTNTEAVDMKRYDLMHTINTRGTFLATKLALPYLKKGSNPHVLNLSPPLNMDPKWFAPHTAYTMAKYGMSMCVLGHAAEFSKFGIGVNALWPRTVIATAAVNNLLGGGIVMSRSRTVDIMADASHFIFTRLSSECTGNFFIDDEVLASEGVQDFSKYKSDPNLKEHELIPDFFV